MKLISLYVENFGKLSNYSYDFSKNLNSIYEENGWGKTTMTVFVKSMLYGLNKAERALYTPWKNLSAFGGYLILEANGKEYRIERQFSPKASGDTFHIYDLATNLEVDYFGPNLGEALLNLNDASFERSVFIPQKDLAEGFGSDIEAKLANLIGGTDDSQSFDDAVQILKNKSHELKLNSKKGLILDKKKELNQIEEDISECNSRMEGLPILQKTIDQISEEISNLSCEKKAINQEIFQYSKSQEKMAKLEVMSKYEEDIENTKKKLEDNDYVFNGHDVTQEEVLEYRSKNKEIAQLRTQYEWQKQNTRASQKIEKIEKEINMKDVPSEELITHMSEQIQKYNNIKSVLNARKQEPKQKKKPTVGIALTIISSILLLVSIILTGFAFLRGDDSNRMPFYVSAIAVAVVSIFGYIGALANFIVTNQKNAALQVGGSVATYDFEKIHLEEEIREFFGKYHLYSSDFSNNLYIVRSNAQRYREAQDEYKDISSEASALEKKIKDYENAILHFLGQFNSSEACQTNEEKIGELNTHLRIHKQIVEEIHEKEEALKQFIAENGLDTMGEKAIDLDELNAKIQEIDVKIDELTGSRTTFSNKLVDYEKEIAQYDELCELKDSVVQEIHKLEEEYRLINLSMDYLTMSQNSLLEKYVLPMKNSVNKYVSMLLKDTEDYSIDVNFKFQFMTNNGLKSIDSYSRGYQTIISLCMRLALIDCLYPNEKPFIILDDPFVNFDDEKLELCKSLIERISEQYQIVYFTCHQSRTISKSQPKAPAKKPVPPQFAKKATKPVVAEEPKVIEPAPTKEEPKVLEPEPVKEEPKVEGPKPSALKIQMNTPIKPTPVTPKPAVVEEKKEAPKPRRISMEATLKEEEPVKEAPKPKPVIRVNKKPEPEAPKEAPKPVAAKPLPKASDGKPTIRINKKPEVEKPVEAKPVEQKPAEKETAKKTSNVQMAHMLLTDKVSQTNGNESNSLARAKANPDGALLSGKNKTQTLNTNRGARPTITINKKKEN